LETTQVHSVDQENMVYIQNGILLSIKNNAMWFDGK
jgi:hypothetical protein